MTPHKYPPLPTAQRDDTDRIGEILDTVRRIEARDTSYLIGQIEALVEENDRLRDEMARAEDAWRNAMAVKDKSMYDLALRVVDVTNTPMADEVRSYGIDVVRMTIIGNTVEVTVGEDDDGGKVAKAIWETMPIHLTLAGKCEAEHDGRTIRFSRATSPSPRGRIFAEVVAERERQEAKFPGQRLPLVDAASDPIDKVIEHFRRTADNLKRDCDLAAKLGRCSWLLIHMEEAAESFLAMAEMQAGVGTREAARAELIQVAAVCFRILESDHFAEAPLSDGDLRELGAAFMEREDVRCALPSSSREAMSHVTHRIGWTESGAWIQHACLACRIGFLVAPGDHPPKCYQCGEEITRTTAAEAYRVWDEEDAADDNVVAEGGYTKG